LLFNLAATIAGGNIISILVATGFIVCCSPCLYYCWMYQIYEATRKNSNSRFGCFFLGFSFNLGLTIYIAVGLPGTYGGAGFMNGFGTSGTGLLVLINGIIFTILSVLIVLCCGRVSTIYRSTGGSVKGVVQAGKDDAANAAVSAATSQTGQQVIQGAVTNAYSA